MKQFWIWLSATGLLQPKIAKIFTWVSNFKGFLNRDDSGSGLCLAPPGASHDFRRLLGDRIWLQSIFISLLPYFNFTRKFDSIAKCHSESQRRGLKCAQRYETGMEDVLFFKILERKFLPRMQYHAKPLESIKYDRFFGSQSKVHRVRMLFFLLINSSILVNKIIIYVFDAR